MGSWGHEVLSNDRALDLMWSLVESTNIRNDIKKILEEREDIDEMLLAVEIVDISLNGVDENLLGCLYDYAEWFKDISNNPMPELKDCALSGIEYIKNNEFVWVLAARKKREDLLNQIDKRLREAKS